MAAENAVLDRHSSRQLATMHILPGHEMFNMMGPSLPHQSRKDLARAHHLRGLTRRRHPGPSTEDIWVPMPAPNSTRWQQGVFGNNSLLSSRFEDLSDGPLSRQPGSAPGPFGYGSPFAEHSKRRTEYSHEAVSFDKAADALCQALEYATKHCKGIKEHFEKEIVGSSISLWAPPKVVDALWAMKVDWDGVDLAAREKTTNQQPSPDIVTYRSVFERLLTAMEDMEVCGRPRFEYVEDAGSKLSPEVFRNTMNKLQVTLRGIGELMHSVRKDRSLMGPLVKDLVSATALLADIDKAWTPRHRPAASRARAHWADEVDEVWPQYHGE